MYEKYCLDQNIITGNTVASIKMYCLKSNQEETKSLLFERVRCGVVKYDNPPACYYQLSRPRH